MTTDENTRPHRSGRRPRQTGAAWGAGLLTSNAGSAVTVSGNNIDGSLSCSGNAPAPADNGAVNKVSGTASGQCAALATR